VKTTFRRLQQLERRRSEWLSAIETSGAREEILARLKRLRERLRANPNWKPPTPEQAEEIKQYFKAHFAEKAIGN
jgi:hypothetical protein